MYSKKNFKAFGFDVFPNLSKFTFEKASYCNISFKPVKIKKIHIIPLHT